jgi:hypothetical protein
LAYKIRNFRTSTKPWYWYVHNGHIELADSTDSIVYHKT